MKEAAPAVAENKNHNQETAITTETVLTKYGELDYDRLQGDESKNPVFLFPGFPLGTTALRPFAEALNQDGRTVIAPNKIRLQPNNLKPTFDKEVELFAGIIESEGLQDRPLDIVAHSNGTLLFDRLAKIADERGWTCFQEVKGSHSIFIAPTGTNSEEKIRKFLPRYIKFFQLGAPRDKALDKDKRLFKENAGVVAGNLRKTVGEVRPILSKKIDYISLGKIASRPSLLEYPQDALFPYKIINKTVFPEGLDSQEGIAESISTPVRISKDLGKTLEEISGGSKPTEADKEHYYRQSHTARHDDLVFNPEATAAAVIQILDGPEIRLKNLKAANLPKQ